MKAKRDYGAYFMGDAELDSIFKILEQKADELGGYCLVFEHFECIRCGEENPRFGLNFCVPPQQGAKYLSGKGRPLVMINLRLCEDCVIWVASECAHETQLVDKALGGLQWNNEDECGEEDKCELVTPVFQSLLHG